MMATRLDLPWAVGSAAICDSRVRVGQQNDKNDVVKIQNPSCIGMK